MNQKRLLQSRSSSKKRNSDPSAADDGTPLPIRILLTGFKPFAKRESNPSETAVRRFSVREIQSRYGLVLDKRILRVSRDAPRDLVEATGSYDIVLHLGVGRQIPAIQLEHLAYNKVNADLRDPSGKKGRNNPIVDGGPWILKSTLPIARIIDDLCQQGVKCTLSEYAGNHICNLLLYSSLLQARKSRSRAFVGFMHIPENALLPMKEVHKAMKTLILTCIPFVNASRRKRQTTSSLKELVRRFRRNGRLDLSANLTSR